ncbi:adenosylcobinamide-phosphate synthase CbiB [Marinicellulosiphila megalodicopiae]|uniref:adenosylcobinamide-phosphate synthase CbiB n=1 Tax=Marinicellulosiphila megalodicopiae TaxID=2724896 RepID=UPI003BB08712
MIIYIVLALLFDRLFGEPKKYHPLVGFGNLANWAEQKFNIKHAHHFKLRILGVFSHLLITLPVAVLIYVTLMFIQNQIALIIIASLILYLCIGWTSLIQHAKNIITPLQNSDIEQARIELGKIVSRDTQELDAKSISKATIESILENGADAVFSAIFWFIAFGFIFSIEAACAMTVFYRMVNTLDAMWGYKTNQFLYFGWFAARLDDVLNFVPARISALSYALMGNYSDAIVYWKQQGNNWKSPNAGPVMAAGAGALNVSLGGGALYHGQWQDRDVLGPKETTVTKATPKKIIDACGLLNRSVYLWVALVLIVDLFGKQF